MSATFDMSEEEQVTRTQFPVMMAFGATTHKAQVKIESDKIRRGVLQGLTLPAVIVSTAKFFAPAQAFVAFSRVRRLEDLYLLDFDETKLNCSQAALDKYNQLRWSVGLTAFGRRIDLSELKKKMERTQKTPSTNAKNPPRQSTSRLRRYVNEMDLNDSEEEASRPKKSKRAKREVNFAEL